MRKWLKYLVLPILGIGFVVAVATPFAVSCNQQTFEEPVKKELITIEITYSEIGDKESYNLLIKNGDVEEYKIENIVNFNNLKDELNKFVETKKREGHKIKFIFNDIIEPRF